MIDLQDRINEINKKQSLSIEQTPKKDVVEQISAPFEEINKEIFELGKKDFWEYAYIVLKTLATLIVVAAAIKFLFN